MNRYCEQCSKVLKEVRAKSRNPQARFCSRKCTRAFIADNRLTASLTEEQETELIRLKIRNALSNKQIATRVGCSINQVRYIWHRYKSPGRARGNTERYRQRLLAHSALADEIAAAKAEMKTAKPYKVGLLGEW